MSQNSAYRTSVTSASGSRAYLDPLCLVSKADPLRFVIVLSAIQPNRPLLPHNVELELTFSMLIVNKDKQSKSEEKKAAARLLRRVRLDERNPHRYPRRHDQGICPVCGEPVGRKSKNKRRKRGCGACGATRSLLLMCQSCGTRRVWKGKKGAACIGCGAPYKG